MRAEIHQKANSSCYLPSLRFRRKQRTPIRFSSSPERNQTSQASLRRSPPYMRARTVVKRAQSEGKSLCPRERQDGLEGEGRKWTAQTTRRLKEKEKLHDPNSKLYLLQQMVVSNEPTDSVAHRSDLSHSFARKSNKRRLETAMLECDINSSVGLKDHIVVVCDTLAGEATVVVGTRSLDS